MRFALSHILKDSSVYCMEYLSSYQLLLINMSEKTQNRSNVY